MEAVGAVGAVVGLTEATLKFIKRLEYLRRVVKDGCADLSTAQIRLNSHQEFIEEFRKEYLTLRGSDLDDGERSFFDRYMAQSTEDLRHYRGLLDKIQKKRTKTSTLQNLETAVRFQLNEEEIKKYQDLVQSQMSQLIVFGARANRSCFNESFRAIEKSINECRRENEGLRTSFQNYFRDSIAISESHSDKNSALWSSIEAALHEVSQEFQEHNQQLSLNRSSMEARMATIAGLVEESNQKIGLFHTRLQSTQQSVREHSEKVALPYDQIYSGRRCHYDARRLAILSNRNRFNFPNSQALQLGRDNQAKIYWTPIGWLHVALYESNGLFASDSNKKVLGYCVEIDPFHHLSSMRVEWHCLFNLRLSSPWLTVWCKTNQVCNDKEVIDALGLTPCTRRCKVDFEDDFDPGDPVHWHSKPCDSSRLRRLLYERRFSPGDFLQASSLGGRPVSLLSTFIKWHQFCLPRSSKQPLFRNKYHCCACEESLPNLFNTHTLTSNVESTCNCAKDNFEYQTIFYPEYFETLRLLVEIGCEPEECDRERLLDRVWRDRCHIMSKHVAYANTPYFCLHSTTALLKDRAEWAATYIPPHSIAFKYQSWVISPRRLISDTCGVTAIMPSIFQSSTPSRIASLIPYEECVGEIGEVISAMDDFDVLHSPSQFDRWLFVLFGQIQPSLGKILTNYTQSANYSTSRLQLESVIQEIQNADQAKRYNLLNYVAFTGSVALLDILMQNGVDLASMLDAAAACGNREVFDHIHSSYSQFGSESELLPHMALIRERITEEPMFRKAFIEGFVSDLAPGKSQQSSRGVSFVVPGVAHNRLGPFLWNMGTMNLLCLQQSVDLPEYFWTIFDGCIAKYEAAQHSYVGDIHLTLYSFVMHFNTGLVTAEELSRPLHFYAVLERLVSSSAFSAGIDSIAYGYRAPQLSQASRFSPLTLAIHCGLEPVVKILVSAGATINRSSPGHESPLDVAMRCARGIHPRKCFETGGKGGLNPDTAVSASIDNTILQILLDAIEVRGIHICDNAGPQSSERKSTYNVIVQVSSWTSWVLCPSQHLDIQTFQEHFIYFVVVLVLYLLSVSKIAQPTLGRLFLFVFNLLSRPIVLVMVLGWAFKRLIL